MQPSPVLTDTPVVPDLQHVLMQAAKTATGPNSSGSMTPQPHAHHNPPGSQTTTSSQGSASPNVQLSSSELSQFTSHEHNAHDISPISSQENDENAVLKTASAMHEQPRTVPNGDAAPLNATEAMSVPAASQPELSRAHSTGQKRTASGQLKRSSITSLDDLKKEQGTRHSRTSSLMSNGSTGSVMELSQQLRTRLSYAMVKVQNGWSTRSLDEVETLASQQGSPRSSVSGFPSGKYAVESPRSAMTTDWRRKWSSSEGSEGRPAHLANIEGTHQRLNGMTNPPGSSGPSRRALAPPATIVPGTRRRPVLVGNQAGSYVPGPYTPNRQYHTSARPMGQRTPSQNAAREADAVETLLFMASPGNSGYHPQTSAAAESNIRSTASQPSPLRTQFQTNEEMTSPRRQVGFADTASGDQRHASQMTADMKDIDQMLEETSDASSDGLEEALQLAQAQAVNHVQR